MVISVQTIARSADTTEQGTILLTAVVNALAASSCVVVSFAGVSNATSSFANAAFAPLLDRFDLAEIKNRLRVVESNRQINDMIKHCLDRYAFRQFAAA